MFKKLAAHLKRGQDGERLAGLYLKRHGLKIITNNHHTRYGEIDIIAEDGATLVFVEVRTRQADAVVSAAESISAAKQRKWQRSAQSYLQQHHPALPPCRFDAVCIAVHPDGKHDITWLKGVM